MPTYAPRFGRALTGLLTALLLTAAPLACRKPAQPSEEYSQAHTRFGKLYAEKGDEAFLDPRLEEIESLLARVPPDSLDVGAANDLKARITNGKAQATATQKAKDDALAKAREPGTMPAGFNTPSRQQEEPPPPPPPAAERPDAGTDAGEPSVPEIGTPLSQLASGFNGCFVKGESLNVQGRGMRDRWELVDRVACRQQYGSLADQVLIIEDGKVLGMAPKGSIQRVRPDAGVPGR